MRDILRWLLNQKEVVKERTKDTARRRLKLVLIQDRIDISPEKMEDMKKEMWEVVSRYMVVEDDFLEFEIKRHDEVVVLVSNIEVKDLNQPLPAS